MADVVLGVAKSFVEGTITKAQAAIEESSKLQQSAQCDLVFIAGEFEMMQSFLSTTTEEQVTNNVVGTWVAQVLDLAYDVEDGIEFVIHLDTKSDWLPRLIPSCMRWPLPLDEAVIIIEQLKARVQDVNQRKERYKLMGDSGGPNPVMEMTQLTTASSSPFDMKQQDMDALTKLVTRRGSGREVISVWELGGNLGAASKSSISKAYDNAKVWGCRAWIKLGNPFDLNEFRRSLIDQFCGNSVQGRNQGPVTEDYLIQEQVNNRRYLVVLEDLSTKEDWDAILGFLPDRSNGSRIVVLTQQFQVARYCTGIPYIQYFWANNLVCVFFKEGSLIGRMSDINQLSGYLAKARMEALQVMSVWGIPGVGKSALVRNLCHKVLQHHKFEKHGWVDVSHPFNLGDFSRRLLLQLVDPHSLKLEANDDASRDLVEKCCNLLRGHKCLVVIDDLQSTQEWKLIQDALVSRPSESFIIVITNEDTIAIKCADRKDLVFNVKPLGVGAAIDLFKTKAKSPYFSPAGIEKDSVLQQLISKCGGLPKVIVAIADILAQSFNWTEKASILNGSFVHNLETSPEFTCLHGLFSWMHCYLSALPRHFRKHVAYLLIFPGDSSIRRRRLVMRWGAEGYSTDTENHTADENGEELFSGLVKQTMIQPSSLKTTTNMRMVSFEVNAIFREYMISRPLKENIATAIELFVLKGACSPTSRRRGRHLVIEQSWDRDRIVFQNIDFSRLRSLTVFGEGKPFFVSENMKVLRVLDLEDASGVTNKDLQIMIKLLPRLKFLSLRGCNEINYLPSSVGKLRQLQILDVSYTNIVTIPASITELKKLQYIRAVPAPPEYSTAPCTVEFKLLKFHRYLQLVGVQVMSGIGKLTALHTLGVVDVGAAGGKVILKELRNLTQLRKLGVSGVSKKNGEEFCSAVLCHSRLESLSVWLDKDNQDCLDGMVHGNNDETSGPANKLLSLKLYGPVEKLPVWTEQLSNLRKLNLEISTLSAADVKVLGGLRELRILRLCVNPQQDGNIEFYVEIAGVEDRCYEMIKVLEIGSRSNLHLTFGSLAMKNLELLTAGCSVTRTPVS
ncbi:unnamed protein product [Urochloa humidicola]